MNTPSLPPVVKSLVVACAAADAFRLYTQDIAKWWPALTHSIGGDRVAAVVIEGRVGGRIFERWHDGMEKLWGTILEWDAPHRVVHTWHVATDPDHSSEIELRFVAIGVNRTRVTLEHRHWERMSGERAQAIRENYNNGWESVFIEKFGAYAGRGEDA